MEGGIRVSTRTDGGITVCREGGIRVSTAAAMMRRDERVIIVTRYDPSLGHMARLAACAAVLLAIAFMR